MADKRARRTCAAILREWEESSTFIDAIVDRHCRKSGLDGRDRAFVLNVCLGVVRNLTLLDHWIDTLRKGKLGAEEARLLEMGLFQILLMRVADHAAVNETVDLARPRARGLINAVLRRAIRERDDLLREAEGLPTWQRYSVPEHLYEGWHEAFGEEEASRIAATINSPAPIFVRSNPLRGGLTDHDLEEAGATRVEGEADFYRVAELPHDALQEGRCYVQDPSTAAAPALLDAQPGERVLDACSAPGGKCAIIAAAMGDSGEIVAVDLSEDRASRLCENLDRLAVTNTRVEVLDLLREPLPNWAGEDSFDRILLDAPCSNTGVLRRRPDARWRLAPNFAEHMASLQLRLSRATLRLLKPGGRFVYSTCSIEPEENRAVIDALLNENSGLSMVGECAIMPSAEHDGAYSAALDRLR